MRSAAEQLAETRESPRYRWPDREGLWVAEIDGEHGPEPVLFIAFCDGTIPVVSMVSRGRFEGEPPRDAWRPLGHDWRGMPLVVDPVRHTATAGGPKWEGDKPDPCRRCNGTGMVPIACTDPMPSGMSCCVDHRGPCPECSPADGDDRVLVVMSRLAMERTLEALECRTYEAEGLKESEAAIQAALDADPAYELTIESAAMKPPRPVPPENVPLREGRQP